jgi:hypothetical protein
MDPYLENPELWPGIHNLLVTDLARSLAPRLRPRYYVAAEVRVFMSDSRDSARRPDAAVYRRRDETDGNGRSVRETRGSGHGPLILTAAVPVPDEIKEAYLEVRAAGSHDLVTTVELLSPSNKLPGEGREKYLKKRFDTLGSRTNLVEIDLLRSGERMPAFLEDWPADAPAPGDYRVLIARGHRRPLAELYLFGVRDRIPTFPLPLAPGDEEPVVSLQQAIESLFATFGYDDQFDYRRDPVPPLEGDDAVWADRLLREAGRR